MTKLADIQASPYYIFCPDFREDSAGVRVLHRLCDALNSLGYEAYVTAQILNPKLNTPRLTTAVEERHRASGRVPITVYPEVTSGNPRRAPIVARYILNRPGLLAGDSVFPEDEILFAYLPEIVPASMQAHTLCIPVCDTELFRPPSPDDAARQGACFFAHRYLKQGGSLIEVPPNTLEISYRHPRSLAELAAIFRRSEVLYSYEISILCWEAMLCGCPVVYLPNDYMRSQPYKDMFDGHGAAWGVDPTAVAQAKHTVDLVYPAYADLELTFSQQLKNFTDITQLAAQAYAASRQLLLQAPASGTAQVLVPVEHVQVWPHPSQADFQAWFMAGAWNEAMLARARQTALQMPMPCMHLAVIVPRGMEPAFGRTLDSLMSQVAGRWRLTAIATVPLVDGNRIHPNLRWVVSEAGLESINQALCEPGYDWVGMLEAGDLLDERTLFCLAQSIQVHPEWGMLYCDEDSVTDSGQLLAPYFKPDFSPEMMCVAPFAMGGLLLLKRELFSELGGFQIDMEGVEYYDLMLRVYERLGVSGIGHVSDLLYHRFANGGHCSRIAEAVADARERALANHVSRLGVDAVLEEGVLPGTFRLHYVCTASPLVSIVIPTRNGGERLQRCIGALVENTDYKQWEVIVVDSGSNEPGSLAFLEQLRQVGQEQARVIVADGGLAATELLNIGAGNARGDFLLFLSDGCAALRGDWLEEMLGFASQAAVGVVGARLIGADLTLSHAGYLLGYEGKPAASHSLNVPMDEPGYFGRLHLPHNPSAVSLACMLMSKTLFDDIGGFDTRNLATAYGDVDFCLQALAKGRRNVWTPHAVLLHEHVNVGKPANAEAGKGPKAELRTRHRPSRLAEVMFGRWLTQTAFDPAYNRNLSLSWKAFEIETVRPLTLDLDKRPQPRILAHPADQSGCGEYRIIAPMRRLNALGAVDGYETSQYFSIPELARMSPDVMIFQRQVEWDQITELEHYLRFSKAFRIYELDDLLTNIQKKNAAKGAYEAADFIERFQKILSMCNRLVVSTQYLADEYGKYINDVKVVPNYLEWARWGGLSPARRQTSKPRVGWAGSLTHGGDLEIIIEVVKATRSEVDWVFLGMCPKDIQKLVKEFHHGVPLVQYPAKLASLNLDLAIAPLEDVPFNHGKSHLKILEYGILGYPVIATDITPYRGAFPITRVPNRFKDWVEAIREQVADREELARRGDVLRDHIRTNWMLDDHLDVWLKAWLPS